MSNADYDDMARVVTVPASPGWYACGPEIEGGRVVDLYYVPVIAWTLEYVAGTHVRNGWREVGPDVSPVVADGMLSADDVMLCSPAGEYAQPYVFGPGSKAEAMASMDHDHQLRHRSKAG